MRRQLLTNLCPVQEAPLLAYTLPLQGEPTFHTLYSILVPERWIRRRCCFSQDDRKLMLRFVAEAGNRGVQGGSSAVIR